MYGFRQKRGSIPSPLDDLPDDGRADVRKARLGDQEDRFQVFADDMIQLGNRLFVIKIRGITKAAQQIVSPGFAAIIRGELFEVVYFHLLKGFEDLPDPAYTLIQGKEAFLLGVHPDGYDDLVEKRQSSFHQVDMTGGDRIEGAREDGNFHSGAFPTKLNK